jgi:hypothetical protein
MSRIKYSEEIRFIRSDYGWEAVRIWAVNCNWNAGNGWNVEANAISNPNDWNAGNRVFSRDSLL